MEMLGFGVLIGMIMSAILIMGGVCYAERVNKRTDKTVSYMDSCGCVLRDGDSNDCDSLVGTDNREEPFGCYVEGKITRGCAITAIREIRRAFDKSLSNTEKDALKFAEEQIYECAVIKINRRKGE